MADLHDPLWGFEYYLTTQKGQVGRSIVTGTPELTFQPGIAAKLHYIDPILNGTTVNNSCVMEAQIYGRPNLALAPWVNKPTWNIAIPYTRVQH